MLDFNLSKKISCFPNCSPAFRFQFYLWDGQGGTAWPKYPRFHYSRQAKKKKIKSLKGFDHHWDLQGSAREGFSSCHPWRDNTNFSSSSVATICTGFVNPADLCSADVLYQILPTKFSFLVLVSKPIELRALLSTRTLQIPELPLQNKLQNLVFHPEKYSLLFSALLWTLNFFYSIFQPQLCQWYQNLHCTIASNCIFPWY